MIDKTASDTSYRGGDGQSVFPIPFPFLENSHISAVVRDAAGTVRTLVAGVDFVINRISEDNGELILLEDGLPEGGVLHICRRVPLTQEIHFHNQGPNSPQAMEEAADKLTMIAQQIQADVDGRMPLPEGISSDEARDILSATAAGLDNLGRDVAALETRVAGKAETGHGHGIGEVAGLAAGLAGKADAEAVATALGRKADRNDLIEKADLDHGHAVADIANLAAQLAAKVNSDDPRLNTGAAAHAASHASNGGDPLSPAAIGAMFPPPRDGKPYLATGGGWIEYIAPSGGDGGGEGGGTMDHSRLLNRNAADQHPQSAIMNLPDDLAALRTAIESLEGAASIQASALAGKADRSELPSPATTAANGLMTAQDKRRLDALHEGGGLPSGGGDGSVLARDSLGGAAWKTPARLADSLPVMSAGQAGVAKLAADGGLTLDAGGGLRLAAEPAAKAHVDGEISRLDGRIDVAAMDLDALAGRVNGLGAMAAEGDAPLDGKPYIRQNGTWREMPASSGGSCGGDGAIVGEIRLLPFRSGELPPGWYFCNGDRFALDTAQGEALHALPTHYKTDWAISVSGGAINLPNLLHNGKGYFLRPVDNASRLPGSVETDAIRNITGLFSVGDIMGMTLNGAVTGTSRFEGAFKSSAFTKTYAWNGYSLGANSTGNLMFDASLAVPTADENRPANLGMTPAIHLGV